MPQLIVKYRPEKIETNLLSEIGLRIRKIVAEAVGTDKHPLFEDDIDWLQEVVGAGSHCPDIMIDIKTIGFPWRKEKLSGQCLRELKQKMLDAGLRPFILGDTPFIWPQFVDPDGEHI